MRLMAMVPVLSERDEAPGTEGGIDPLGLAAIADRLGTKLVPGVRERQLHPRFLTAMAVSLAVCEDFESETVAKDGISEPWQVFEWYLVEGLARTSRSAAAGRSDHELAASGSSSNEALGTRGVPGSLKARQSVDEGVPLSARRYLRTPTVFGFHGVYRLLARTLGVEEKSSGRLGETGFELVNVWAKERGLTGFLGTADGPGRAVRKQLVEAVNAGLELGATAKGTGWSGWKFFREHLDLYSAGSTEAGFIMRRLLDDHVGFRREVIEFLVSSEGRNAFEDERSERAFHAALRLRASDELASLLDAISVYESFSRLCQDAFDDCLVEMTRTRGKTSLGQLGSLPSVKRACREVPELFEQLLGRLEPFGESARLSRSCERLAARCSATDWASGLLQHHCDTQRRKPPEGRQPWIVLLDGGHWQIRTRYQREKPAAQDGSYVHAYRTNSLWNFARDLKVLP